MQRDQLPTCRLSGAHVGMLHSIAGIPTVRSIYDATYKTWGDALHTAFSWGI